MVPECVHHVELCPECGGLQASRLERVTGIASIEIDGAAAVTFSGPVEVFVGQAVEPCPATVA